MKFAICNEIFQNWKFDDIVPFVAQAGYEGIEIAPFTAAKSVTDVPTSERRRWRELAQQHNLAITGIHWVLAQTEGLHLTHPDPQIRARTSDYFGHLVDFCADLGGKTVVLGSPKQRSLISGVSLEQADDFAFSVLQPAVRKAQDRGVIICFEPLGPAETDFINTATQAISFVDRFSSPHCQIILDVKAMSTESKPIPEIIHESRGRFAYFHANDKNMKGPGFGEIDFTPIAKALRASNYDGWVSVEVFDFTEGPERIAKESLDYLRRTFQP
ncbi:MAG: sugar phosphate isomerase/epimerase [Verrucomicrobia bacterium]|nr:sugar phosphate isomerase/epimerase [Verrucomicrobiota bacterium]